MTPVSCSNMDITAFVIQGRDKALLYGDYSIYHAQLSKKLLNARRKLGISTRNRGKFHKKDAVTAEEIGENREHVYLSLLTCERAWARAMSIKSSHATDQKGVVGRTRSHILSRLHKSAQLADQLVEALTSADVTGASTPDILEAKAYAAMIQGSHLFEKQSWEVCLQKYSVARIIYSALASVAKADIFKDLLSETIDPSIRYAAYQLKTPRTIPIPAIAVKAFPHADTTLASEINKIDPTALNKPDVESDKQDTVSGSAPQTLTWRSREVKIEDAQIATAWQAVQKAKASLAENLSSIDRSHAHEVAATYDDILTATQDAVDATKVAIDELKGEGVGQGDPRMQSLQITRTAVNFEMVSWRIGRNRVLTGPHDGATEEYGSLRRRGKVPAAAATQTRDLPTSRKLAKLKEKSALYDGTLQNLKTIKELPGVAADESLVAKLEAFEKYFQALVSLAVARSHAIIGNVSNALALINHSLQLSQASASQLPTTNNSADDGLLNVEVTQKDGAFLNKLLTGELQRHRAIVHIDNLRKQSEDGESKSAKAPLIERLNEYPVGGVDLGNIVQFPPKVAAIPVKPIFLDVAWNYIDYEYAGKESPAPEPVQAAAPEPEEPQQSTARKGWFGFGRS